MSWVGTPFRFTEKQAQDIFIGIRVGTAEQRAAFVRAVEGAVTASKNSQQLPAGVLLRRATAVRDAARRMLEVMGDGEEAGFTLEQLQTVRELMKHADIHATDTCAQLAVGGRPAATGKALAAWICDAYRCAFEKQPSLASGSTFEKLLGNIANECPLALPTDPRLLRPAKTP